MIGRAAPFLPAAAVLGIWIAWIPLDGGYFAGQWYPAALFSAALLAVVVVAGRRFATGWPLADTALGLMAALVGWSFLSIGWAASQGAAWAAANQLLLYFLMAALIALVPWRPGSATVFLGAWSLGVAGVCAGELIAGLGASDLRDYVLDSRWQQPTGYANGAAGIAAMALWPALTVAARKATPVWAQALFLATAAFLACFLQLPQSRGALIAAAAVLPLFVALSPERGRLLGRLGVVGLAGLVAARPIYDVYQAGEAGDPIGPALDGAAKWMALSVGIAIVGAFVLLGLERTIRPNERIWRATRRGSLGTLAVVAIVAAAVGLVRAGAIADEVGDRWRAFKSEEVTDTGPRLTRTTSDKRYDYWRVSVDVFRDSPVAGAGAGNFEREYTIHRRYSRPSRAAHSIWMRALLEGGAVGIALLGGLVAVVGVALFRVRSRLDDAGRWVVAGCSGTLAYFLLHASVDWLDLLPAVTAPGAALAFVALALGRPTEESQGGRMHGPLPAVGVAALTALVLLSLLLPYLSARYIDDAAELAGSDPAAADRALDRAAALNPLSIEPHQRRGSIAMRQGRFEEARRAFEDALEVEDSWYPHYGLALLAAHAGDFAGARRELERARELNPPDPLLADVGELIRKRVRIDPKKTTRETVGSGLH